MPAELAQTLVATEDDRLLQAEALVRAFCGWHVAPVRTTTVRLDPSTASRMVLPTLRLVSVDAVSDGVSLLDPSAYTWTEDGVLTLSADYTVASWAGDYVFGLRDSFPLVLTITHGYDEPPADVTGIVQAVAQRAVDNPSGVLREQVGPFMNAYSAGSNGSAAPLWLQPDERAVLARHKLPPRL